MGAIPALSDAELTVYAAQAGASSSNWTMAGALKFMRNRRMDYYKATPGDCGSAGFYGVTGTTGAVGSTIGRVAMADPEPISHAILSGISKIFGIFTAHHAQAVMQEQTTLCAVTGQYNQFADQIEAALSSGQLTADQASAALDQVHGQLDQMLASISKEGNAGWGFRIDLAALVLYNKAVVYPAMAGSTLGGKSGLLIFGGAIAAAKFGGIF